MRFFQLRTVVSAALALALTFTLTSCDSGPEPPPPEPPENTAPTAAFSAEPQTADAGSDVTFDAAASHDDDGSITDYAWSFGDGDSGTGETTTHTYDSTGDYDATLTVTDDDGATGSDAVDVTITEAEPDNHAPAAAFSVSEVSVETDVAVSFDAAASSDPDGDGLTYEWDFADGNSATGATTEHAYGEAGEYTVTLAVSDGELEDTAEETIAATEPTTSVTVSAVALADGESLSSTIELTASGETIAEGQSPLTADVPESIAEVTATAKRLELETRVFADTSQAFSVASAPITLSQRRLPACSNGLDDDGDGLVDVWMDLDGNGIPTEGDAGDPGCTGPADDNEAHVVFTRTSSGFGFADTVLVSSDPNNWTFGPLNEDFPSSVQVAVGNIYFASDVKISASQTGESFAHRFSCDSSVHTTDVVADDPSVDGWYRPIVEGIEPSFFAESTDCEITILHKAFVNNNPGDGNDDVIFGYPSRTGTTVISWVYQPDLNGNSSPAARGTHGLGKPGSQSRDGDVSVRDRGYVNSSTADW